MEPTPGSFYRTISGVRLCWELEEPEGPKGCSLPPPRGRLPRSLQPRSHPPWGAIDPELLFFSTPAPESYRGCCKDFGARGDLFSSGGALRI